MNFLKPDNHPFYSVPPDSARVWRYVDVAKFVALLESAALFFPSASVLERSDHFEGSVSEATHKKRTEAAEEMIAALSSGAADDGHRQPIRRVIEGHYFGRSAVLQFERRWTYVSCWHVNDFESAAMWKLYAPIGQGIGIQSTVGKLLSSLSLDSYERVIASVVKYIDYGSTLVPENWALAPFFHKRRSFAHENELRVVVQQLPRVPVSSSASRFDVHRPPVDGIEVAANLGELVEQISLAPDSADWIVRLVTKLTKRYGLTAPVVRSLMNAEAIF